MNNIISQDFWCATLSKDNPECSFPDTKDLDEDLTHHLMIEQAVIGLNAKETCMIEATSTLANGEKRSSMICQLIPKSVPNCHLTLSFKQVTLKLASGSGPVYLTGTYSQEVDDMEEESDDEGVGVPKLINGEAEEAESSEEDDDDDDEEELDNEKMMEELAAAQSNKLKDFMKKDKAKIGKPAPASKKAEEPAKKQEAQKKQTDEVMKEEADDEDEEESDEDDDDDDENEVESDDDDDDDEEEEEEEDDDEGEEEEDESEEESEEDEEEEETPVTKKRKTESTPVAVKNNKPSTTSTPKPKQQKTPSKPNMNELKKKLLASPNLPKKYDKFVNLMKNAHKISDDKEIKNVWEFVQKSKK